MFCQLPRHSWELLRIVGGYLTFSLIAHHHSLAFIHSREAATLWRILWDSWKSGVHQRLVSCRDKEIGEDPVEVFDLFVRKRGKSAAGHIQLAEWLLNGQEAIGPWRRTAGCFQPLEESLGVCCSLVFILFYFFLISYDSFVCHCGANMNKQWQKKSKSSAKVLSVWTITIATSLHCSA